ncbi:MAG TPA: diacylglycerol kinase family protein [Polyangiaceae bacterium]|nr:diacylglycerol kinase family protein [Polyangiaceae bacterium]
MSDATHLLVGNPTAQSGANAARIDRAVKWLASAGIVCDVLPTLPGGKTIGAVADALRARPYACVISMGGDGTFREVASGLIDSGRAEHVAMGMLPTGTANDQGRSFGLDAGDAALEPNLAVVAEGHETRLDAGKMLVPGQAPAWFFDSAGWGISARVLRARNEDRALVETHAPLLKMFYRDHLVYAGALLRVFLDSFVVDDAFTATVEADGRSVVLEGLTDLVVKGTRVYGGAWVFDRNSRHDDGRFEVVPFRGKLDWTSKAIVDLDGNPITEEMLNTIGVEHSHPFSASRMTIRFTWHQDGPAPAAQIDGEEYEASKEATIEVVPRVIRLIVP